ncbi:cytochrome P450 76M5-like [Panicum miliaceum]|uniref:Cytochrome P450 76M5-like n=1 Tax=Panicum miliaceum TaxID=4540 RepID=A0A3L6Q7E1_PANMI|nr:cytochrome P450 76M5-like [Panicum miliaceum]
MHCGASSAGRRHSCGLRPAPAPKAQAAKGGSNIVVTPFEFVSPGPAGLPLIGTAVTFFGLLRRNQHRALARLAGTYGPIFSFRPGRTCAFVVLSSPALAREALAEKEAALAARFVPDSVRALGYGAGSMAFVPSSDPLWKRHRATAGAFLTSARGLNATRRDVIAGDQLPGMFERVVGGLFEEWAKPNVSDAFPFLAPLDLFGSRRRTSRNLAQLYELFHGFVECRLAGGDRHGDMLDAVLERHAKSQLTRSDIAKLFTDMFIGASETSNITAEWAMAHLLRRPDKMERLRAEIAASLGAKDFVEESDLGRLPYLHAVVKETLRLHPAVPVVTREVAADGGVSLGGFPVAAGTCVLVNLWAIGRDPAVWPDRPDAFVPERFLGAGLRLPAVRRGAEDVARVGLRGEVRAAGAGLHAAQDRVEAAGGDGAGGRGPQRPLHSGAQARQAPRRRARVHGVTTCTAESSSRAAVLMRCL